MLNRHLAALALLLAAPLAPATSIDVIKDQYTKTWNGVRAFKCDIHIETRQAQGEAEVSMDSTGSMQALRQSDDTFHWRMDLDLKLTMPTDNTTVDAKVLSAFDGEFVYTIMSIMGQKQFTRTRDPGKSTVPVGEDMWTRLEEDATLTYQGESEIDGVPVYLVHAQWNDTEDAPAGTALYAFKQDTALVMRAEIDTGNDAGAVIMTASGYDLDADVSKEAFQIEIPVGASIIDLP